MPRERIYARPNPDGSDSTRRVEVGWAVDQDVQIATTVLVSGADRDREFVDGPADAPMRHAWDGQWVELDRQQINDLIRHLRRARDQAYGRDE